MVEIPALAPEDFAQLRDYLYRRTGMMFAESKRYYVEPRLAERMAATNSVSFGSYFARLRGNLDGEIEQLVNALTVNETYFYREIPQLACLTSDLLGLRVGAKKKGAPIRIWSVPCSTGEEPFSIAIWLLENWREVDAYEIEIIGSDIDTEVLSAARAGIFGERALMKLTPDLIAKYFNPMGLGKWRIIDNLQQSIKFTSVNVVSRSEIISQGRFDIIFCRNMLIYFDEASRRAAAENLYESLEPGGFICLGHTESMSRISPLFEVCRFSDAVVYRRPVEDSHG